MTNDAEAEREAIVAWLRKGVFKKVDAGFVQRCDRLTQGELADAIERGDHREKSSSVSPTPGGEVE